LLLRIHAKLLSPLLIHVKLQKAIFLNNNTFKKNNPVIITTGLF